MKIFCILLLLLLLLPVPVHAAQPDIPRDESLEKQMKSGMERKVDELDLKDIDKFIRDIQAWENPIFNETSAKDIVKKLLTGDIEFDMGKLWLYITNIFFREITANLGLMAKITVLAVISGVLKKMHGSFQNTSTVEIAHFACYMVVILVIIQSISSVMSAGQRAIDNMLSFTQILLPVLLVLLVSVGGVTSSALLNPTIGLLVGLFGNILRNDILSDTMRTAVTLSTI